MKKLMLATLMIFGAQFAKAQSHVKFSEFQSGGTGCKAAESAPKLSIAKGKGVLKISTLGISNANNASQIIREACSARVLATIEKGYQLGIRITDVAGSISQSAGVRTTVTATAGLAFLEEQQTVSQEMDSQMNGRYKVSNKAAKDSFTWTDCADQESTAKLAISANAFAVASAATSVNASVKTVNFQVVVRACQ